VLDLSDVLVARRVHVLPQHLVAVFVLAHDHKTEILVGIKEHELIRREDACQSRSVHTQSRVQPDLPCTVSTASQRDRLARTLGHVGEAFCHLLRLDLGQMIPVTSRDRQSDPVHKVHEISSLRFLPFSSPLVVPLGLCLPLVILFCSSSIRLALFHRSSICLTLSLRSSICPTLFCSSCTFPVLLSRSFTDSVVVLASLPRDGLSALMQNGQAELIDDKARSVVEKEQRIVVETVMGQVDELSELELNLVLVSAVSTAGLSALVLLGLHSRV